MKQQNEHLSTLKSGPQEKSLKDKPQQPWERPRLRQLRVSLDTAFSGGSLADGFTGTS